MEALSSWLWGRNPDTWTLHGGPGVNEKEMARLANEIGFKTPKGGRPPVPPKPVSAKKRLNTELTDVLKTKNIKDIAEGKLKK